MVKTYPSFMIYRFLILFSICIVVSRDNWFFLWVGVEVSLFGFLPLFSLSRITSEGIIKYFLIQARGSMLFFFSCLVQRANILVFSMSLKLGLFPFFQWIPVVIRSLSWVGCMLLSTRQKINPVVIIILIGHQELIVFLRLARILISRILGINQVFLRPLMAYSSISHTSWMVLASQVSFKLVVFYIFFYFTLTITLFYFFIKIRRVKVHEFFSNSFVSVIIFNLSGIPPLHIFYLKFNVLLLYRGDLVSIFVIVLRVLISTYYYINMFILNLNRNLVKPFFLVMVLSMSPVLMLA